MLFITNEVDTLSPFGEQINFFERKVQLLIFTQQIQIPELENAKESIRASSHVTQVIKNQLPVQETQETCVQSLGQEDPLQEASATHSSILA